MEVVLAALGGVDEGGICGLELCGGNFVSAVFFFELESE